MPTVIDNIELDETNVEFNYATEFVNYDKPIIYITGKAGTGKTTFLKYLKQHSNKHMVIVAPTGVAAVNAGGQTIHSFFQIRPSVYEPNDKRLRIRPDDNDSDRSTIYDHFGFSAERLNIIKSLQLLIIDEISMVRCDLLDVIDRILRVYRKRLSEPFGGVQVILIGDTFQLPPIAVAQEWEILKQFYESPFFFSSKVITQNKPSYLELKKIYRQTEIEFIDLLNKIRVNQITQSELIQLNNKVAPAFSPPVDSNYITLATHNRLVESTNLTKLSELKTELKIFAATITGTFPDSMMPTERTLQLKEGAQIMFIKNKLPTYHNGKIGKIKSIAEDGIIVELIVDNEITEVKVEKEVWNNTSYSWNDEYKRIEEQNIGTFCQFPLRLAWAITVHKSQGLTFEKVIADLGNAFSSGQVYVALSRCTSINGLILKSRIDRHAIITDPQVLKFAKNEMPTTLIVQEINYGKANFYYKKAREAFKASDFNASFENFTLATKFRNDIETDVFKRYFSTHLLRLHNSKNVANQLLKEFDPLKNKNNLILQENSALHSKNQQNGNKIDEQNKALKLLLDKSREFEKRISDLEEKNQRLKQNNKELSNNVDHITHQFEQKKKEVVTQEMEKTKLNNAFQENDKKLSQCIKELEIEKENLNTEVNRLRNIKWHQKLIGIK